MAIIYPEGTQQKLIGKARYEFSSLSQYSETTSEYEWWSENYNRQSATSDLFIWSVMPCYELPNGPYVGVRLKVNNYKHAKGLLHFRPNNDTTAIGFTCMVTASEIGSTTGNIAITHGWHWHYASSSSKPFNRANLSGGSGGGNFDNRVGSSARTHGNMLVMEFD